MGPDVVSDESENLNLSGAGHSDSQRNIADPIFTMSLQQVEVAHTKMRSSGYVSSYESFSRPENALPRPSMVRVFKDLV